MKVKVEDPSRRNSLGVVGSALGAPRCLETGAAVFVEGRIEIPK